MAYELNTDKGSVSITYGKDPGEYYGTFDLYEVDETLAIIRNDYTKFRNEVVNFNSISYIGDSEKGIITLDSDEGLFKVCVVTFAQWQIILNSISSWSNTAKSKFKTNV